MALEALSFQNGTAAADNELRHPSFMGSVVFCVGGCLPVLLDASFATTANADRETVMSHLISLDVAGML